MFVTRKKLNYLIKLQDNEISELRKRYWELKNKYYNLLSHLGLNEVDIPARTELRKKGGPEMEIDP